MSLIRWRESLSLGVPSIDTDHRRLIHILNHLHFMAIAGDDRAALAQVLRELLDYAKGHFAREEMLMRLAAYPGYEAHRKLHRQLTETVMGFEARYHAKPRHFDVQRFYDFVADWLMLHILEEDMKIQPFVARLASTSAA